jgi:hypothetical protein
VRQLDKCRETGQSHRPVERRRHHQGRRRATTHSARRSTHASARALRQPAAASGQRAGEHAHRHQTRRRCSPAAAPASFRAQGPKSRKRAATTSKPSRGARHISTLPTRFRWSRTGTHRCSDPRPVAGALSRCRDEGSKLAHQPGRRCCANTQPMFPTVFHDYYRRIVLERQPRLLPRLCDEADGRVSDTAAQRYPSSG